MTDARTEIFRRLEAARPPAIARPAEWSAPPMPIDEMATLRDRLSDAGGSLQIAQREDWTERIVWPVPVSGIAHVYSSVTGVSNKGVGISALTDHDLECLDLCVLSADFAVVENGAVWHRPESPRERAAALLATHLMIVVDAGELVPTLHHAYSRIGSEAASFGWFLCGPSKTADIEQALVLGAHGPCTMSLILLRD
jgi:L-lactate dehydrogenase complex protein LldG